MHDHRKQFVAGVIVGETIKVDAIATHLDPEIREATWRHVLHDKAGVSRSPKVGDVLPLFRGPFYPAQPECAVAPIAICEDEAFHKGCGQLRSRAAGDHCRCRRSTKHKRRAKVEAGA